MPYNEKLTNRIREALIGVQKVEEKKMFRGICFMVNGKMCICVSENEIMCRIDPTTSDEALEKNYTRPMMRDGKQIMGYVYVSEEGYKSKKNFNYWISLCLEFNTKAKASKKKM
jgi:TfoX/Sxy family transcriptional regulator of competence genes